MAKIVKKKSKSKPNKKLTRKELRKQKLVIKKENKRLFFSNKTKGATLVAEAKITATNAQHSKKAKKTKPKKSNTNVTPEDIPIEELLSGKVDSDNDESIASDFSDDEVDARLPAKVAKREPPPHEVKGKKKKQQQPTRPDPEEQRKRVLKQQKDLENVARKQRMKQLKLENEEEDRLISKLEKKLKLNKTKDKNRLVRKMFSDGLDYALEFCLDDEEEKRKRELKEKRKEEHQRQHDSGWSDEEEFGLEDGEDEDSVGVGTDADEEQSEDEMESAYSDEGSEGEERERQIENNEEQFKEDIYGRKRDKEGNIITEDTAEENSATDAQQPKKYIPPHQRASLAATQNDSKQTQILERLRKNCKGLLNRLSETNLHKIASGIEELYMKNSRNNINETLAALLREALIGHTMANERMVQEHMVLLAYLHAQVGNEIGAHFLQMFVEQFDAYIKEIFTLPVEDKRLNNLILILAYIYIFKIYEHRLLLEIIGRLSDNLCEKSIECLLLIFQSVGFKLRKDDPLAFKEMMLSVQRKIAEAPLELKENLRLKFMVDILNAVKNNNINKIPQFDPELAENLRKRLKAMLRNDKYVTTLNITIDDLLRADQVGKWWVVGSAWSGNIDDINAATKQKKDDGTVAGQRFSEKLLKLAKQQKMNTEERRNIFCIIMGAEDYVDAFEKILHLALKDQRSIAYVIIHCCLNEKRPNPYYAHLALKFCHYNRKYQLAFQFATWDRINDIDSLNKIQVKNLAKFLQHLILNGGLQLTVLKVVNFLQLDKLSFLFMKEIMVGLLLNERDNEIYQAFERVAKNSKLGQFKNSVRLFIQHFLLQNESKLKLEEKQMAILKKRADYVDSILAYVDL
ncbi:nucleolar MIF4G domain-containing protein 1 homolog [Rhagoletis pomonella]|uniref:nucleolar MIF4G domain-containing protein 1 homolog n=1 Tax=Rhagoletis pomonella TaxID=28610 RepID=UPI00177CBDC0|nr:nucleolar MIF4G domain-containing protein 1 homolog [Rhagoletis pomonella]XP_036336405.1 nucleolar MIF4G domain-containing protein 1 homolog [Rhagoletis pomonella]